MPIIIERHLVYVSNELPTHTQAFASEIDQEFWKYVKAYDESYQWELKVLNPPQISKLQRVLSRTVWDRSIQVSNDWQKISPYNLGDISRRIKHLATNDDDIILQWLDKKDIQKLLSEADSYEKIEKVVRIICGEHEHDKGLEKFLTDVIPDFFEDLEE